MGAPQHFCIGCGAALTGERFCTTCGRPVDAPAPAPSPSPTPPAWPAPTAWPTPTTPPSPRTSRGLIVGVVTVSVVAVLLAAAAIWFFGFRPSGDDRAAPVTPPSTSSTARGTAASDAPSTSSGSVSGKRADGVGPSDSQTPGAGDAVNGTPTSQPAGADTPDPGAVNDRAGVDANTPAANAALQRFAAVTGARLTVVLVPSFGADDAQSWADSTFTAAGLSGHDLMLVVAPDDHRYGYHVGGAFPVDAATIETVIDDRGTPKFVAGQWSEAIVAVSDGLADVIVHGPAASSSVTPMTVTTTVTPTEPPAPANPMDQPPTPIACAAGYIVQVASELTEDALRTHVDQLIADGTIPPDTKWAHTKGSCDIFSIKVDAVVLYAGPFAKPYDGCAARLHSPADAFIKGTTKKTAQQWISCLCPAQVSSIPTISKANSHQVWVGVAQRVLANKLSYAIKDRDGDPAHGVPSNWGVFTPDTVAAVKRFQQDAHVTVTGHLDAATWKALQSAGC